MTNLPRADNPHLVASAPTGNPRVVALAAEGLVKQFEAVTAVNGVSLTVQAGEIVGLLGPAASAGGNVLTRKAGKCLASSARTQSCLGREMSIPVDLFDHLGHSAAPSGPAH